MKFAKEDWKTQSKKKGGNKAKKINQTLRTLRTGKTKEKTKQRQKNLEGNINGNVIDSSTLSIFSMLNMRI